MTPDSGFEWVKSRSECTAAKMFQRLSVELEQDVSTRNSLRDPNDRYAFTHEWIGHDISIAVQGNRLNQAIIFRLTGQSIGVQRAPGTKLFDATVTLCNDGACRFKVNGQPYESWQFRKMALEELFFNGPWD